MVSAQLVRVAGVAFLAVTLVVLGDTAGKLLGAAGVHPLFVAWARFALAVVVLVPTFGLTRDELRRLLDWRVLLRGALVTAGIASILTALKTEPIANVYGAFFVGPIVSYLIAVTLLGERASGGRLALLGLGFVGVLMVVKPGLAMSFGTLMALLAGCCYGGYLAATRLVAGEFRPRALLGSQLLVGAVLLTPFGLSVELPTFDVTIVLLLLGSAAGSAAGNYLLVIANRMAEASLIAPLVYSQLLSATLVGVWVFGDWPDALALAGLALICLSGFASLWLVRKG